MLIIDVLEMRVGGLAHNPKSKSRVFTCKVMEDIKGNYKGDQLMEIIFRSSRKMNVNGRYFVLIEGHTSGKGKYYSPYILSWEGANHKSIFKVENENILDPNQDLKFNGKSFSIDVYKNHVRDFYNKMLEGIDDEN